MWTAQTSLHVKIWFLYGMDSWRTNGGAVKVSSRCDPDAPQNGLCGKKGEGASSVRSCKCGQDCLLKAHCAYLSLPMTRSLSLGTVALLCWRFRSEKSNSTTKKKKKKKIVPSSTTIMRCCRLSSTALSRIHPDATTVQDYEEQLFIFSELCCVV